MRRNGTRTIIAFVAVYLFGYKFVYYGNFSRRPFTITINRNKIINIITHTTARIDVYASAPTVCS